jgi:16S rRNA U516 pseudouridylate synthase RsuA-like enzyme
VVVGAGREKKRLSLNSVVEAVLNQGTEKSVKRLFELIGIKRVSDIFFQQTSD